MTGRAQQLGGAGGQGESGGERIHAVGRGAEVGHPQALVQKAAHADGESDPHLECGGIAPEREGRGVRGHVGVDEGETRREIRTRAIAAQPGGRQPASGLLGQQGQSRRRVQAARDTLRDGGPGEVGEIGCRELAEIGPPVHDDRLVSRHEIEHDARAAGAKVGMRGDGGGGRGHERSSFVGQRGCGAVEARVTSAVDTWCTPPATGRPSIWSTTRETASEPAVPKSWRTVVSGGQK